MFRARFDVSTPRRGTRGDLYQSEHSERPRYTKYPEYTKSSSDDDEHIFVGWVGGTPKYFSFFALALVPCLILLDLVALSFVVALPVLGRTLSPVFLHLT